MIYIVTYDLNNPDKNYDELFETLKTFPAYSKILKSTWLIASTEPVAALNSKLFPFFDKNDSLFIARLYQDYNCYLPKTAISWIKDCEAKKLFGTNETSG